MKRHKPLEFVEEKFVRLSLYFKSRWFWLAIFVSGASIIPVHAISRFLLAQNPPPRPIDLACLADAEVSRNLRNGGIRFAGTEPGRPIRWPRTLEAAGSAETAARAYMALCGSLFGIQDQSTELRFMQGTDADLRRSVIRFQQVKAGIPILGAELIVHLDSGRDVLTVVAKAAPNPTVSTTPVINSAAATQAALDVVAKTYGNPNGLTTSIPELWIYDPALIGPGTGFAILAWRIEVTSATLLPIRELVLADAQRGSVALHFNQVEPARNRLTYTANNTTTLPGNLVCDETNTCLSPPNDSHVAAAHLHAADTYNFYFANFGRDSINNAGLTIVSTVRFSSNYQNAFWNGTQMVYGDGLGFPLADDVVGHELTHGVTQYTSNLFYYYQSGAINESLSDVFGEFVDLTRQGLRP
jgi:hypothetical protein